MLTRQRIKLQQSTNTDRLRQTSGKDTTNQYEKRKTVVASSGRKQRKHQPYHRPEVKSKKACNNLTGKNEEQSSNSKPRQQTHTKPNKAKVIKKKTSDAKLNDLKTIDTTIVHEVNPGTWGMRLAVFNDNMAWCSTCYAGTIALFNTRGRVIQKLKLDLKPVDISVNFNNDLICCEFKGRYIWKFTNKKQEIVADLYPYQTRSLCWTSENQMLVCLQKNYTVNKVVRIAPDGKILQTIQKDKYNKIIFGNLSLIAENINKDICVVDNYNNLIVLDKDGNVKFKFLHTSDDGSQIFGGVYGIACDSLGCILLSDTEDNCLHMISGDGQYLQKIPTQTFGVENPWGLGTDNKNQLWIVNNHVGNVKIIKYRS